MQLEEEDTIHSYDKTSETESTFAQIYEGEAGNEDTIQFRLLARFFNVISEARGGKKSKTIQKFISTLFKKNRKWHYTYSILRLLIPAEDKDRGNYGLKEKALAKLITNGLNLSKDQYERLYHYKNPNYHKEGMGIGDFSICMYDVVKDFMHQKSSLTVKKLNEILDKLVNVPDQVPTFRELLNITNATELKWIVRIILKDLKLGIKVDTVLNSFHPDAAEYLTLMASLGETCKKFENPKVSLNDEIQVFHPIKPMLAGKKKVEYFKSEARTFYLETKYDGQRLQVHYAAEQARLYSRNNIEHNHVYEQMVRDVGQAIKMASACILDGEIIVIDAGESNRMMPFGLNKTNVINKEDESMQLCYKIFDILWLKVDNQEMNMMIYPLRERKKILPKVIEEIPGKVELVKFREVLDYDDIVREFNASSERNEEGIMLKDPNSVYVPKERANNWLKLKGDHIDGMTESMDLVIIGGYYGDLSFRQGKVGSHWTNQVTSFLVAVLESNTDQNSKINFVLPFGRVGMGFSEDNLKELRARLKPNLVEYNGKNKPEFLRVAWKYSLQNKPDCYVKDLTKSIILEVKAAELISTAQYPTDCTFRHARCQRIRFDKEWKDCMTKEDLLTFSDEQEYTKTLKRKNQQASDSDEDRPLDLISKKKRRYDQNKTKKGSKKAEILLPDYVMVDVSDKQLVSHLFHGKQFSVMPLWNCEFTTHQIEEKILLNGGLVSKNPVETTQYIVMNQQDFKLRAFERGKEGKFTFIKPKYIINCINANKILSLSPIYLTTLPRHNARFFMENFDKFGDSYTEDLDTQQLQQILLNMGSSNHYYPNQRLIQGIGLKYSRSDRVSLSIGVSELDKIKLQMQGNKLVNSYEERPNSIIIGDKSEVTPEIEAEYTDYMHHYGCDLEHVEQIFDEVKA